MPWLPLRFPSAEMKAGRQAKLLTQNSNRLKDFIDVCLLQFKKSGVYQFGYQSFSLALFIMFVVDLHFMGD